MLNSTFFTGSLVKKGELRKSKNSDNKFMYITVAKNYSRYDEDKKEWDNYGTIFVDCLISGRVAENFDASNVKAGDNLIIAGRYKFEDERSFTSKNGNEVNVAATESVIVDEIGMSFKGWKIPMAFIDGQDEFIEGERKSSSKSKKSTNKNNSSDSFFDNIDDEENDIIDENSNEFNFDSGSDEENSSNAEDWFGDFGV